jgi:hypothetical protein
MFTRAAVLSGTAEVLQISDEIAAAQRTGVPCQERSYSNAEGTYTGCSIATQWAPTFEQQLRQPAFDRQML